jgi:hypothetical protein
MKRIILAVCLAHVALSLLSQELTDSLSIELEEMVVNADRVIHKGDHEILYLSEKNKMFGTNALDAISSLPLFQTSLNDTKLTSWDRQEVYILINGVPSIAYDLRSYRGSEIKNIEYYSVAPSQYMSITQGPVINVIVKKRHDKLYAGYINTANAVNTGFGTNQVDLTYADSLNQLKLGYVFDYRDVHKINSLTEYRYSSQLSSSYKGSSLYRGNCQTIRASYQRYQARHLFNVKLSSVINPLRESGHTEGTITTSEGSYQGDGESLLKTRSVDWTIDLYYRYLFKNGRTFAVNVLNTFGNSYSNSERSLQSVESYPSDYDYNIGSRVDNGSYSLIANALLTTPLLGGKTEVGTRYEYKQLDQVYLNNKYRPYSHNAFLHAGGSWRIKNSISIIPTAGLSVLKQVSTGASQNSFLPYFRFYSDWWGQGRLKGTSVQLTMSLRDKSPALSEITESGTYLDPWLISVGNPDLKYYWTTSGKFVLAYFSPSNKNDFIFMAQPSYAHNKTATVVIRNNENVYLQPQNLSDDFECDFNMFANFRPFKWLEISPYMEYNIYRFNTLSQRIRFHYFRIGGVVTVSWNRLAFLIAINPPTKIYDGDLLSRGSAQYACSVQYKWRNWSFGARCNYSGHNEYITSDVSGFAYLDNKDWQPLHRLVTLTASYSFSVGKSRTHEKKIIQEVDEDNSGLGKFNKPRMAK